MRSVSFNPTKVEDKKILEFIENQNFSGYVKALILDDIARRNQPLRIRQNGGIKYVVTP